MANAEALPTLVDKIILCVQVLLQHLLLKLYVY